MKRQIPQRKRVYIGCEGESERSYIKALDTLLNLSGLSLAFKTDLLNGNPLSMLKAALKNIDREYKIRGREGKFEVRAVFLDTDTIEANPECRVQVDALARRRNVLVIWQDPCHEAFLLRHFEGKSELRPPTPQLAEEVLRKVWPDYKKPAPAIDIQKRIDHESLKRVAYRHSDFQSLLKLLGFKGSN